MARKLVGLPQGETTLSREKAQPWRDRLRDPDLRALYAKEYGEERIAEFEKEISGILDQPIERKRKRVEPPAEGSVLIKKEAKEWQKRLSHPSVRERYTPEELARIEQLMLVVDVPLDAPRQELPETPILVQERKKEEPKISEAHQRRVADQEERAARSRIPVIPVEGAKPIDPAKFKKSKPVDPSALATQILSMPLGLKPQLDVLENSILRSKENDSKTETAPANGNISYTASLAQLSNPQDWYESLGYDAAVYAKADRFFPCREIQPGEKPKEIVPEYKRFAQLRATLQAISQPSYGLDESVMELCRTIARCSAVQERREACDTIKKITGADLSRFFIKKDEKEDGKRESLEAPEIAAVSARNVLLPALKKYYSGSQDKLAAFAEGLDRERGTLTDQNPLKTYTIPKRYEQALHNEEVLSAAPTAVAQQAHLYDTIAKFWDDICPPKDEVDADPTPLAQEHFQMYQDLISRYHAMAMTLREKVVPELAKLQEAYHAKLHGEEQVMSEPERVMAR